MSLVKSFAPHLPFLRRYARALTGSQESGDAYIRASLQALVENPEVVEDSEDSRLSLYRFFHVIWGTTGAQLEGKEASAADPADKRLQALAPIQRQAFLLTALEGFSASEAAYILHEYRLKQVCQRFLTLLTSSPHSPSPSLIFILLALLLLLLVIIVIVISVVSVVIVIVIVIVALLELSTALLYLSNRKRRIANDEENLAWTDFNPKMRQRKPEYWWPVNAFRYIFFVEMQLAVVVDMTVVVVGVVAVK
mgnify:CR=1 FL=1